MATPSATESPTLIVLAAGMGSRFGGDKQIANVGPRGETILDFTTFDALRSGFGDMILVVRRENQATVAAMVGDRIARHIPVRYVFQDIAVPLPGLRSPPGRTKPWGTGHALACALRGLDHPCGVVNADDWYSPTGIRALAALLARRDATGVLVTYPLVRTLSPNGPVNRAVCASDAHGLLTAIDETIGIVAGAQGPELRGRDGTVTKRLAPDTKVSLNLWGFQRDFYQPFIADVEAFIRSNRLSTTDECMLPTLAMTGCTNHGWTLRAELAQADWTGLTYQEDRPAVQARLQAATDAGDYPSPLWS
ncbi:MAG: NTP transferase domain-containing protein [Planctomycetota bacterium]